MGNYIQSGVLYEAGERAADNALVLADKMNLPINGECRDFWRAWFGFSFANPDEVVPDDREVFDISGYLNQLARTLSQSAHPAIVELRQKMDDWAKIGGTFYSSMEEVWPTAPEVLISFGALRALAREARLRLAVSPAPSRPTLKV